MNLVRVQQQDFDSRTVLGELRAGRTDIGATVTFIGYVRDLNLDDDVEAMLLEHYPGMTEKELGKIVDEASSRWNVIAATVIHRVGDLVPGDEIVFVGVASRHRGDAFQSCEFIMDFLKTRATFWKKEKTPDGDRWLDMRASDVEAAEHWGKHWGQSKGSE